MTKQLLLFVLFAAIAINASAQKKREIIPHDTITGKYAYTGVSDSLPATKEQLKDKLDKWIKQNYNTDKDKYASVKVDNDTYELHDREALHGKTRKFVEYNLTVDVKEHRYRYKLTDLEYVAVGKYPLEDKMATDQRKDFEAMDEILRKIIASMEAAVKSTW